MFTRGSAAVALINALERSGGRVEVVIAYRVTSRRGVTFVTVQAVLKRADDPLNLLNLAFPSATPPPTAA